MSSGVLRSTHKNASCLTQQVVKVIRHKAASLPHTDGPGCANVHPCLIHGSFGQPESTTQTVSRSVQSKSVKLHIIGRPNHILVISRRNAFITFRPNIGCDRNTPFVLCVRECHRWICWSLKSHLKTKLCIDVLHRTKLWPFCEIFAYFGQNVIDMATFLIPLQSEISSLDWLTLKPYHKTKSLSITVTQA